MTISYSEIDNHIARQIERHGGLDSVVNVATGGLSFRETGGPLAPSERRGRPLSRVLDFINLARAYRSVYCHIYNQAPETTATLAYAGQFLTPEERHNFSRAFCGDEPNSPAPPFPSAPFEGGQCNGVLYRFTQQTTQTSPSGCIDSQRTGFFRAYGPITGYQLRVPGQNGECGNGFQQVWLRCRGVAFQSTEGDRGINPSLQALDYYLVGGDPGFGITGWAITSLSRVDGGSDNCGNPSPTYPGGPAPVLPWPGDLNPPGEDPGWSPWPLNPSFEVGPDGIRICFDTPVGRACFSYDGLDLQPGTPGGDDPSPSPLPGPDGAGPDSSDPAPPYPPDLPPEDDPTDEDTRIIRGVIVTAEGEGSTTVVFQEGGNPDVLVPDCGLVNFKIRMADGTVAWTEDQRVKNGRNLIVCPWPYGAINVKGTARGGYSLTLTPIYDELVFQPATP